MLSLTAFARQYASIRDVCAEYAENLATRAAALEASCGLAAIDRVLTEPNVNAFLRSLMLSPYTVRSYRGDFISLWNAAADLDLLPYPQLRRIYRPNVPDLVIDCFTLDEARRLLVTAKTMAGAYPNGVARRRYWAAAIPLAWDAGLRRSDVWRFRRDAVRPDGTLRMVQKKTGRLVVVRLRASTLAALDAVGHVLPCQWVLDRGIFGRHFKAIVKESGVGRGSFKFFRRSSGSYVESQQAGAGSRHLGHSDPKTFDKFYDAKLGGHSLPMPPEL